MYFSGGKFNTRQLPLIVLNIEAYIAFSVSIRYMSRSGEHSREAIHNINFHEQVLIIPAKNKWSGVQGSEIICRLSLQISQGRMNIVFKYIVTWA